MRYSNRQDISIDVDNVLREIIVPCINIYNKEFKTSIKKEDVNQWDLSKTFKEIEEAYIQEYFFKTHAKEVFEDAEMEEGTTALCLRDLIKFHNIHLVTHQYRGNEQYTINWLQKNDIQYTSLHFSRDKSLIKSKILLDDSIDNLKDAHQNGIIPICMAQPWNKTWDKGKVSSLSEFTKMVYRLYGA